MGRWEPNARERLQEAAMTLFDERGYEGTTVEDIAAAAGLTERTFFRYFADKREVLFSGSADLERMLSDAIVGAPKPSSPLDAVVSALEATSSFFDARRAHARRRQALVAANAELRERELIKMATLTDAAAASLRSRGVKDPGATLVAETGILLFKHAFDRWVVDAKKRAFDHHVRAVLVELRRTTAEPSPAKARPNES